MSSEPTFGPWVDMPEEPELHRDIIIEFHNGTRTVSMMLGEGMERTFIIFGLKEDVKRWCYINLYGERQQ